MILYINSTSTSHPRPFSRATNIGHSFGHRAPYWDGTEQMAWWPPQPLRDCSRGKDGWPRSRCARLGGEFCPLYDIAVRPSAGCVFGLHLPLQDYTGWLSRHVTWLLLFVGTLFTVVANLIVPCQLCQILRAGPDLLRGCASSLLTDMRTKVWKKRMRCGPP